MERSYSGWAVVCARVSTIVPGIIMAIFTVLNLVIHHTGGLSVDGGVGVVIHHTGGLSVDGRVGWGVGFACVGGWGVTALADGE
eukprot:218292-Chlamydomonas_euryale.AAC.1